MRRRRYRDSALSRYRRAGSRLAVWLREQGRATVESREPGPGDRALPERGGAEGRIPVTSDAGFGKPILAEAVPHAGMALSPNGRSPRRSASMAEISRRQTVFIVSNEFVGGPFVQRRPGGALRRDAVERAQPFLFAGNAAARRRRGARLLQHPASFPRGAPNGSPLRTRGAIGSIGASGNAVIRSDSANRTDRRWRNHCHEPRNRSKTTARTYSAPYLYCRSP